MSELRDQHKAFAEWFLQQNPVAPNAEDLAWAAWKAALAQPETEAGVSWDGHNVRGDADSIAEVRRLIDFEQARQGAKPETAEPPSDEWRPASEPPEDGRDVVVWCEQERRAVHGMYVRRHPPVVGLVDGWVAPDASKLTHWRDVQPPTEGE